MQRGSHNIIMLYNMPPPYIDARASRWIKNNAIACSCICFALYTICTRRRRHARKRPDAPITPPCNACCVWDDGRRRDEWVRWADCTGGPRRRSINEILFSRRRRRRPFNFRRRRHFIFFSVTHRTPPPADARSLPAAPTPPPPPPHFRRPAMRSQPLHTHRHRHRRRRRPERFGAASAREKMQIRREFYRRGPTPPPPPLPLAIGTRRRQRRQTGRRRAVRARGPCTTRRQRKAQLNSATTRSATPFVLYIYIYARPM